MTKARYSRKLYKTVAEVFRRHAEKEDPYSYLLEDFQEIFKKDNPNFDVERFRRAIFARHD